MPRRQHGRSLARMDDAIACQVRVCCDGQFRMIEILALEGMTQALDEDSIEEMAIDYIAGMLDIRETSARVNVTRA